MHYSRQSIDLPPQVSRDELVVHALGKASLLFSFLLIYFCGYFPFDFSFSGDWIATIHSKMDLSRQQFYTASDTKENILFFMPLGFALALLVKGHLGIPKRLGTWGRWLGRVFLSLLFGAFVSSLVEIGQCFLGDRDPSLVDIVNNALGTAIAFGGTALAGPLFLPPVVWLLHRAGSVVGWKTLAVCSALWAVASVLPLRYARDFGDLARWDTRFPIAAGNSVMLRPWRGTVKEVMIADRAVKDIEADRLLDAPLDDGVPRVFGPSMDHVKAWFDFTRGWPITDKTGNTPPFDWYATAAKPWQVPTRPASAPATQQSADGLAIDGRTAWLSTDGPARELDEAVKKSSQLTFVATVATTDCFQFGPARVVIVGDEQYGNNFNIGQDRFDLAVRLRARVTARSGQAPQIMVTDVFADMKPKRILVTYQPWHLRIFVDDVAHKSEVTFTPEAALMWQLYPRPMWKFRMGEVGTAFYRSVYRCLFFAPLGLLLAMTVKLAGLDTHHRLIIIAAGVVATCVVLEWVGSQVGIVGFRASGAAVCLISATVGAALVSFRRDAADETQSA